MIFDEFWAYHCRRKKPIEKDLILFKHLDNMVNDITSMFTIRNLPLSMNEFFIQSCLLFNGSIGVFEAPNFGVIAAEGGDTDEPSIYGFCDNYHATTVNGEFESTFTKGKDGVCIYNNHSRTPDFNIITLATQFTETEISENQNVLWSRVMPIPYADDEKEKNMIIEAIKNTIEGKPATIISSNTAEFNRELYKREKKAPLTLSDIRNIPFLQYLAEYWDVLNRRYYTRYGHSLQSTSKHAQVSRDEVNGLNSVSWIYPLNMLDERKKGFDEVNKLFGTNITIEFAEPWKTEYIKYVRSTEQETETTTKESEENGNDNKIE